MDMPKKQLVAEALIDLHRRLTALPTRSHERRMIMQETANLYGVSEQTLYRALAQRARPRALRRSDRGTPRVLPQDKMELRLVLERSNRFRGMVIDWSHGKEIAGFVLVIGVSAIATGLAAWLVRKFAPGAKGSGSGIPDVEAALRDEQPPPPLILIPVKFLDGVLVWVAQHLYPD
jgi:hypothetical protein